MKKLALDIEQLRVETYVTGMGEKEERGTVRGNQIRPPMNTTRTQDFTCVGTTCGSPTNAAFC